MSTLQTSVASTLRNAGIPFTGGKWLRLKGKGPNDALSINAESGGWIDHRTGEHGGYRALGNRLGFDAGTQYIPPLRSNNGYLNNTDTNTKSQQWAKTQWARGVSASDKEKHQDCVECVDTIYTYLASRGLDPLPLLPMIKFSSTFNGETGKEMQALGADFYFMVPMYSIGKPQIAANICGIQRTYLSNAGAKIGRRMLGKKGVTEIKSSSEPIPLPTDLRVWGVGEGFETVVSFVQSTGHGGLVCWDWSGLKNWSTSVMPNSQSPVVALLVDSDTSQTGQRESAAAYRQITSHEHGKAVYLLPPDSIQPDAKGNRDWNDLLKQSNAADFAAEIVNAWHKSDANLALAPVSSDSPEVKEDYSGPKKANIAQIVTDAIALQRAQEVMREGISQYASNYADYLKILEKWKTDKSGEKPKLPPLLVKVTTGVGKSHFIRELVETTDLPLLILVRTHGLASDYIKAGAYPYHGRKSVSEGAVPQKDDAGNPIPPNSRPVFTLKHVQDNLDKFSAADCFKYDIIEQVAENNHIPALTACRNCEHGRKFMIVNYAPNTKPHIDAQSWFAESGMNQKNVPSCMWLRMQEKTHRSRIVVAPNASYSETLAAFKNDNGDIIPRLVIVDELPDLTKEVEDVHSGALGTHVALAQKAIEFLQRDSTDEDNKDAAIHDLETAVDLFKETTLFLAETVGKGIVKIHDELAERVKKLHVDWLPGATARWEKADIRYGEVHFVPLRMARALIHSVSTNTAFAENGTLKIREVTGLGEHFYKAKPAIYMDATPSLAVETILKGKGGQIVHAIAKQHINLVHYNQYLHGRTWKNKDHQQAELTSLLVHREDMQAETGNVPNVLTYMKHCELAGKGDKDVDWGYFGRDDIGQDRWKTKDLLVFGGSMFGPTTQATAYNSELMLMRLAGIQDLPDWSTEVERDQLITVRDKLIPSKAPLPVDPHLRDWVLSDYGRRMAQAIGRVRGVWATDKPINVRIVGGLPLAGLAEHSIEVNEYRQEKLVDLRDEAHKVAVQKVQVAMASLQAADQDPSYRQVNQWLTDHGLPSVRYSTWKTIVNKALTGLNNDIYEPVNDLLASLHSLQKVAGWQGLDISDVALNTWNAPNIDPEIRIAAEIILQVSPNAHKWRSDNPV